jgi:hypothetical protein
MNTTTLNPGLRQVAQAATGTDWTVAFRDGVLRAAAAVCRWALTPREARPLTAEHLLAMADAYHATQPSFAADLRAAALRSPDLRDRG